MGPIFPTKELQEENDRLMTLFLDTKENIDVDEFIEKNASNEYKKYLKDEDERQEALFEQGIVI